MLGGVRSRLPVFEAGDEGRLVASPTIPSRSIRVRSRAPRRAAPSPCAPYLARPLTLNGQRDRGRLDPDSTGSTPGEGFRRARPSDADARRSSASCSKACKDGPQTPRRHRRGRRFLPRTCSCVGAESLATSFAFPTEKHKKRHRPHDRRAVAGSKRQSTRAHRPQGMKPPPSAASTLGRRHSRKREFEALVVGGRRREGAGASRADARRAGLCASRWSRREIRGAEASQSSRYPRGMRYPAYGDRA